MMSDHPVNLRYIRKLLTELLHTGLALSYSRAEYPSLLELLYQDVQWMWSERHLSAIIFLPSTGDYTSCGLVSTETVAIKKVGGLRGVEGCGLVVGGDAGCQEGGGGVTLQEGCRVGEESRVQNHRGRSLRSVHWVVGKFWICII